MSRSSPIKLIADPDMNAIAKLVLSDPAYTFQFLKRLASIISPGANVAITEDDTNKQLIISASGGIGSATAGPGISTTTLGNGSTQISTNLVAGQNITLSPPDPVTGAITISATAPAVLAGQGVNVQSTPTSDTVSANLLASTGIAIMPSGTAFAISTNIAAGQNVFFSTDSGGRLSINAVPSPTYSPGYGITVAPDPSTASIAISANLEAGLGTSITQDNTTKALQISSNLVAGSNVTFATSGNQITISSTPTTVQAGAGITVNTVGNTATVATNLVSGGSVSLATDGTTGQITISAPVIAAGTGVSVSTVSGTTTVSANLQSGAGIAITTNAGASVISTNLVAGTNITLTNNAGQITIDATALNVQAGNGITVNTVGNTTTVSANLVGAGAVTLTSNAGQITINAPIIAAGSGLTSSTVSNTTTIALAPLNTLIQASATAGNQTQITGGVTAGAPISIYTPAFTFNTPVTLSITTWTVVSTANPAITVGAAVWTLTNQLLAPGLARLSWIAKTDITATLAAQGTAWNTGYSVATSSSSTLLQYLPSNAEYHSLTFVDTTPSPSITAPSDMTLNTNGTITLDMTFLQNIFALGYSGAQSITLTAGTCMYATAATTP